MTIVANFEIHYTQFLDACGKIVQELPQFAKHSETLLRFYRQMLLARCFDSKAVALQRTGRMGTYASTLGMEAVSVGAISAMDKHDILVPAYREYGGQFLRGVRMRDILAYWGGDERGNAFPSDSRDMPLAVPIGSQCLHATGIATAVKLRKQNHITVCFCGDGATSEGDFYEAINVAGAWKLPILFIINNNQWAISVPRSAQSGAQTLAQKAIAGGFSGEQVDGNDIIAMHHCTHHAINQIRNGSGPHLIEAITYRLCDHTTADDAKRYADPTEYEKAKLHEPISRLKNYLMAQGYWNDTAEQQLLNECKAQVEQESQAFLNMSIQPPQAMFDYLYESVPKPLEQQYDELASLGENQHG